MASIIPKTSDPFENSPLGPEASISDQNASPEKATMLEVQKHRGWLITSTWTLVIDGPVLPVIPAGVKVRLLKAYTASN